MKSRKQRHNVRGGGGKKKVPSDVSPATSLPPLVEGPLRCFLRVTVSRVLWTVHKPPSSTFVRLRWWGESSNGTHFFPRDGSQLSQKTVKTTARFAIHCGPKQFTSYLTDMSSLVLEVLTKPDHLPIARAQVAGISRLTLSHSISGFYTLVSPTSEKLGELQVSLNLEPLTEAYDSSSSGPVTDISTEGQQVTALTVPSRPRSLSAGSGKESAGSGGNTPRGKDHLYFQNVQKDGGKGESLENQMPTTNGQTANPPIQDPRGQTSNDILSVILERGNKLKNAMVVSALMDSAPALKDTPLPLPKDNILPHSKPFPSTSGILLQNILHADSSLKHCDDVVVASDCSLDMDNRAVDLLLGSLNTSPLPVWDGDDSLPESLSGHSSVCDDSELNDPQYDQSLLENLFYKTPTSDIRADDTEPEGRGAATLSKTQTQSAPKISGGSNSEHQQPPETAGLPPGVSAESLTFLSSIRLARVTIESLNVAAAPKPPTPRKTSGKPPRPLTSRKCTYFVEYAFPVASTSSRSKGGDGEVTRVVSNKVSGGAVKFQQNSVFPVHFSTSAVKKWWETDLVFKVYSRKSDQKKPVPIGQAVHPLSALLQSKPLSQSVILPVQNIEGSSETQEIGPLKVSLELIGGSNNKLTPRDVSPSQHAPAPQRESQRVVKSPAEGPRLNTWSPQKPSKAPSPHPGLFTSPHPPRQQQEEDPEVLLHTLLMVPDGRNFTCGPTGAPNVYLNCKLWCDETARSVVSWGQANPCFNFVQVTPVTLSNKLLERMKNNVMVIEVWQKTGSSGQDRLLGIVKLPLHQFYVSFRDPKITRLLLQAQFPVLGVDCYMPLIDVFSGSCRGQLRVVLAMGRSEQIVALQRTRDEEHERSPYLVRPIHLLDHQPRCPTQVNAPQEGTMREHVFVLSVERINGLTPLQSTVWGEADCYVQYSFPCQDHDPDQNLDQDLIESSVNLKPFRTTTTLCVPDPEFGHSETHVLLVPEGVPVQRLLLSCLSTRGLGSGGGVQFEVWCRYYYPNVRDQLVAKGILPLSRLCAMVTMQRQRPDEAQMFSLPLIPRTDGSAGRQPQPSGLLDVCIRYKHRPVRRQAARGVAARVVTLVVEIHRASGLQAAARVLSEQDERFSYFAGVGMNAYVTVQLSFLPESERRCTRVAARTFSPEFEHHMEVCCDLLSQRSSGETCSLAELLEDASAVFTVWNKDSRKAVHTEKQKDVVLGSVKIPLADLIHKRTGISGWFGVHVPQETGSSRGLHVLVGGLELSINFAHHSERERVVKAAQGVSWETHNETLDDEEAWTDATRQISLTFSVPRAWIPVHCLLLPGLHQPERSTYCYFRYKFYDQEAFCSPVRRPSLEEEDREDGDGGPATVSFQGSRTVELRSTRPLMWYLREEKLEVQVWVAFTKDKTPRPRDTDRLVGSAFVDLTSLTKTSEKKQTISGVYPLFRRSAADLQGAALRVHVTMTAGFVPGVEEVVPAGSDVQEDSDNEGEVADRVPSPTSPKKHKNKSSPDVTSLQHTDSDDLFPVTVVVDQAMHLNLKGCPLSGCSEASPSCCVSYVTADSAESVFTEVVSGTDCPVWSHQLECRLSKQLLVDPQQSLVFKVWHKGEAERVIGFASVDLSPLVCGLQSVCGWYNITDFSGQCHGQLKVSITPLKALHDLRGQRKTSNQEPARSSLALPHNYNTTATIYGRHPEQKTPDHTDRLFSERSSESERHFEHMDNVRLYHQSLQEQTAVADLNPSSSLLFSALRKKLSELDDVQRYFSRKLTTPTFPTASDQDGRVQQEDTETDTSRLLLKSNHLVGQVNNIINGLRGHHLETFVSDPQSSSTTSPVGENPLQTVPETSSSPPRPSRSHQDTMCLSRPPQSHQDTTSLSSPPRPPRSPEDITSLSSPARPSWSHQDTRCLSRLSQSHQDVSSLSSPHRPSQSHQDTMCLSRPPQSHQDTMSPSSPPRPPRSHQDTMCLSRPPQSHQDTTSLSSPHKPAWSHQDPVSPPGSSQDRVSPLWSPKTPERHADSESEEDKVGQTHKAAVSEDEDEEGTDEDGPGGTWDDEADDEEDGEDYEEVVLKPRSLNEVTSLTDRTSPWTSVLSDAGSLDEDDSEDEDDRMKTRGGRGSLDGEDEEDGMKTTGGRGSSDGEDEDDRMKTGGGRGSSDGEDEEDGMKTTGGRGSSDGEDEDDGMKTRGGRGSSDGEDEDDRMKTRGGRGSSDGEDEDDRMKTGGGRGSSGDVSDGEDDRMKTGRRSDSLHGSSGDDSDAERDGERTKSPEDGASLSTPHATITHDASCSPEITIKPSSRLDVPNFFLPSHQLEASLRAIRLAPSFSQTSSHPGPSSAFPRIPRRLPDMSPTSRKKETERIARIFSTRCDDHH